MLNGLSLLIVGFYLAAVGWRGNGRELLAMAGEQKGFIPWGIAFVVLWLLWRSRAIGAAGGWLLALTFAAFLLQAGSRLFTDFDAIMAKLKG